MNRNAIGLIAILASAAWLTGQANSGGDQKENPAPAAKAAVSARVELLTKPPIRLSHKESKEKQEILQGTIYVRRVAAQGAEKLSISGSANDKSAILKPPALSTSAPAELTITLPAACKFDPARVAWGGHVTKPSLCKPASGHLLLTNSGAGLPDQSVPLEWTLTTRYSREVEASFFVDAFRMALSAVAAGIIIAWVVTKKPSWTVTGDSNWDLGKSWATNATIGSSLLTGVLALIGFPDQTAILPKPEYALVSLWTASLVGIGAAAYSAFTWPEKTGVGALGVRPTLWGFGDSDHMGGHDTAVRAAAHYCGTRDG